MEGEMQSKANLGPALERMFHELGAKHHRTTEEAELLAELGDLRRNVFAVSPGSSLNWQIEGGEIGLMVEGSAEAWVPGTAAKGAPSNLEYHIGTAPPRPILIHCSKEGCPHKPI